MIHITLTVQIPADLDERWIERITAYTAAVRAEPGNLTFDCYRSIEDPASYVIVEGFASPEAGAAHLATDHFRSFLEWGPGLITGTPKIINTEVDGWSDVAELQ